MVIRRVLVIRALSSISVIDKSTCHATKCQKAMTFCRILSRANQSCLFLNYYISRILPLRAEVRIRIFLT